MNNPVIPTNAAELEEMLNDSARMQEVFKNKASFGEFVKNYAGAVMQKDEQIAEQVRNETQRVLAEYLRENEPKNIDRVNLDPMKPVSSGDVRNGLYNPRAMGSAIDKEFANSAEFFQAIWHNTDRNSDLQNKLSRVRNAFSSTVPSEGGFLVPETLRSEILRVSLETAVVRPRARVIPMETLRVPFPAVDATSNASSVFGGIVGYWTEEGAALTSSAASFGRIVLDAKKLTAYTEVPNELVSDSVSSFQAFIDQIFPEALAYYEDDAFINGSGTGEPLGVLNGSGLVTVTGSSTGNIVWADVVSMFARMLPSSLSRAVWIASPDTFPELATMTVNVQNVAGNENVGGSAVWISNGAGAPPVTLLGRPVIFSEKVPANGTAGCLSFVDFGHYLIGDRQVMSAMSSPHYKFQNDMTAYRIIERVDGRPWLQSAITPKNGGSTLSPYVTLDN